MTGQKKLEKYLELFVCFSILLLICSVYWLPGKVQQIFNVFFPLSLLISLYKIKPKYLFSNKYFGLLIYLVFYLSISSYWSSAPGEYFLKLMRHGLYIIVGFIVVFVFFNKNNFEKYCNLIFLSIVLSSLSVVLMTYISNFDLVYSSLVSSSRLTYWSLTGLRENPIHSGFFIGLGALVSLYLYRKIESDKVSILFISSSLFLISFVILTKSRGAILFLGISIIILFLIIRPISKNRDLIFILIFSIGSLVFISNYSSVITGRIGGESVRLEMLFIVFEDIKSSPIFGSGWSGKDSIELSSGITFSKVHNSFVHVLQVGGVVAFIPFVLLTFLPIYKVLLGNNDMAKLIAIWLVFGSLYIAVDGRFPIIRPSSQWIYYWIPLFILISCISSGVFDEDQK